MSQVPKQQNTNDTTQPLSIKDRLPSLQYHLIFWPLTISAIILDLWSKAAVFHWIRDLRQYSPYPIIDGILQFVVAENTGAAFGIASGKTYMLISVSLAALVAIILLFLFGNIKQKLMIVALALFTAGICGNLYDRIFNEGRVRDFIDVVYFPGKHWPAFNIADSLLCVSVALMFISSLLTEMQSRKHDQQQK